MKQLQTLPVEIVSHGELRYRPRLQPHEGRLCVVVVVQGGDGRAHVVADGGPVLTALAGQPYTN